jgi:hypothetical protein
LLQVGDAPGNFRRHAVAMNVPIRTDMAQKPAFFLRRQPVPQRRQVRPQAIEHAAPVIAVGRGGFDLAADPANHFGDAQRTVAGLDAAGIAAGLLMNLGQQPAARQGDDRPVMPAAAER